MLSLWVSKETPSVFGQAALAPGMRPLANDNGNTAKAAQALLAPMNGIDRRSTLRVLTMPVLQTAWDKGGRRRHRAQALRPYNGMRRRQTAKAGNGRGNGKRRRKQSLRR